MTNIMITPFSLSYNHPRPQWNQVRSLTHMARNQASRSSRRMLGRPTHKPSLKASLRGYVCPLRLALYGHPDAGGIWEKHCKTQLKSVGWIPILPEIWQSVFYHPELELMLVVHVDDFKMAGPTKNMAEGWKGINSVIDMDPPEATMVVTT